MQLSIVLCHTLCTCISLPLPVAGLSSEFYDQAAALVTFFADTLHVFVELYIARTRRCANSSAIFTSTARVLIQAHTSSAAQSMASASPNAALQALTNDTLWSAANVPFVHARVASCRSCVSGLAGLRLAQLCTTSTTNRRHVTPGGFQPSSAGYRSQTLVESSFVF